MLRSIHRSDQAKDWEPTGGVIWFDLVFFRCEADWIEDPLLDFFEGGDWVPLTTPEDVRPSFTVFNVVETEAGIRWFLTFFVGAGGVTNDCSDFLGDGVKHEIRVVIRIEIMVMMTIITSSLPCWVKYVVIVNQRLGTHNVRCNDHKHCVRRQRFHQRYPIHFAGIHA